MAKELQYKGTVRITVPTSVGYNLKKFQQSLATLAGRLGCAACFSGADCVFQLERDYLINETTLATRASGVTAQSIASNPAPSVTAAIPMAVSGNLKLIQKAVASIAGRLGCLPCTSGFDLIFQQEIRRINPIKVQITEAGIIG